MRGKLLCRREIRTETMRKQQTSKQRQKLSLIGSQIDRLISRDRGWRPGGLRGGPGGGRGKDPQKVHTRPLLWETERKLNVPSDWQNISANIKMREAQSSPPPPGAARRLRAQGRNRSIAVNEETVLSLSFLGRLRRKFPAEFLKKKKEVFYHTFARQFLFLQCLQ